jgi:hypothetical protein
MFGFGHEIEKENPEVRQHSHAGVFSQEHRSRDFGVEG